MTPIFQHRLTVELIGSHNAKPIGKALARSFNRSAKHTQLEDLVKGDPTDLIELTWEDAYPLPDWAVCHIVSNVSSVVDELTNSRTFVTLTCTAGRREHLSDRLVFDSEPMYFHTKKLEAKPAP